jgi:hypothetical protein
MKIKTAALVTAVIIALVALTVPQAQAGTIYANGTVTLAAGGTNATQAIGLYNITGQEWGEIVGFRLYNGSTNAVNVTVTCEDMAIPITVFQKDATVTNTPQHLAAAAVYSAVGSGSHAKTLKVAVSMIHATNVTAAVTFPFVIYAK